MHFMNPVPQMKMVEIIRGLTTSDEVFMLVKDLVLKMGKTVAESKDVPGFISNRILQIMNEPPRGKRRGIYKESFLS